MEIRVCYFTTFLWGYVIIIVINIVINIQLFPTHFYFFLFLL